MFLNPYPGNSRWHLSDLWLCKIINRLPALFTCPERAHKQLLGVVICLQHAGREDGAACRCPAKLHSAITHWAEPEGWQETAMARVSSVMNHRSDPSVFGDSVLWWPKFHKHFTENKATCFPLLLRQCCCLGITCGAEFLWVDPFPAYLCWNILCWGKDYSRCHLWPTLSSGLFIGSYERKTESPYSACSTANLLYRTQIASGVILPLNMQRVTHCKL